MKKIVTSLLLTFTVGAAAMAQTGTDSMIGPVMRYDRVGAQCDLLVRPDVQADLRLDQAAKDTIMRAAKDRSAAIDVARTENAGDQPATMRAISHINNDYDSKVWHALARWQRRRAMQIFIRTSQGLALEDPEVQNMMGLTPDQKDKITQIDRDTRRQNELLMAKMNDGMLDDSQIAFERHEDTLNTCATLKRVLTGEQRSQWDELCGGPFMIDPSIDNKTGRPMSSTRF